MKIYIAGHKGMVGSAVLKILNTSKHTIITKSHSELDLTRQADVENFFSQNRPDYIIDAAAKVGGIVANNNFTGDFIRDNLLIQTNLIECARKFGCKKFCFLGSSCVYPKLCPQPIREEYLLSSNLEETNIGYAVAKIAGIQMIRSYRQQYNFPGYSLMPTNLYGCNDKFDPNYAHALPSLIYKIHQAKINNDDYVLVWGKDGSIKREWMYVDDLADIIIKTLFMDNVPELLNVGVGHDISINSLAFMIKEIIGFNGEIKYDPSKPEGTPQKLLDISKMNNLGLSSKTNLKDGIKNTYKWFLDNYQSL